MRDDLIRHRHQRGGRSDDDTHVERIRNNTRLCYWKPGLHDCAERLRPARAVAQHRLQCSNDGFWSDESHRHDANIATRSSERFRIETRENAARTFRFVLRANDENRCASRRHTQFHFERAA